MARPARLGGASKAIPSRMTIRLSQQLLSSQRTALPVRVLAPPSSSKEQTA
jgi:hypothetical protein